MNKATGRAAGLGRLRLSSHSEAAIGDVENDHALLRMAESGVATANAIHTLRDSAHYTSGRDHRAGRGSSAR